MSDTTKEIVMANLESFHLQTEVSPKLLEHLCRVQGILDEIAEARTKASALYRDNKPVVAAVAARSKIARQTFYNNPTLVKYVEAWAKRAGESPLETIERLRQEIREKNVMIKNMVKRDAETAFYQAENKKLTEEVSSLRKSVRAQNGAIAKLQKKLMES